MKTATITYTDGRTLPGSGAINRVTMVKSETALMY
jgi:hypothetical protein